MSLYIIAATIGAIALVVDVLAARQLFGRPADTDELERLTAPWAPAREDLTEPEYEGAHRLGKAKGAQAQRARWNCPTGEFWEIRDRNYSTDELIELESIA